MQPLMSPKHGLHSIPLVRICISLGKSGYFYINMLVTVRKLLQKGGAFGFPAGRDPHRCATEERISRAHAQGLFAVEKVSE